MVAIEGLEPTFLIKELVFETSVSTLSTISPLWLMVAQEGLEPTRELFPRDFKSRASTSSATGPLVNYFAKLNTSLMIASNRSGSPIVNMKINVQHTRIGLNTNCIVILGKDG